MIDQPTPALYFATHHLGTDAGLQVTGSHNPPEFNGFKMVHAGEAVHGDQILALHDVITRESWRTGTGAQRPAPGVLAAYRDAIISRHRLARPVKVVVDCGNGVGSLIAVETLERLGAEVVPLFCESDGTFPNHHPDPTVLENLRDLQAEVRCSGAELGLAFDGDADRLGAVGSIVGPPLMSQLFARFSQAGAPVHLPGAAFFAAALLTAASWGTYWAATRDAS